MSWLSQSLLVNCRLSSCCLFVVLLLFRVILDFVFLFVSANHPSMLSPSQRQQRQQQSQYITDTKHTAFIVIICYFLLLLVFFYATKLVLILDFIYFSFFLLYFLPVVGYAGLWRLLYPIPTQKSLVAPNFQLQTNSRNEWLNNNWMKKRHQPSVFAMNDQQTTTDQRSQPPKSKR